MPLPTLGVGRSLLNPPTPAGDPIAAALLAATVRWHKFESAALTADEMGGTALTNVNGVTATPGAVGTAALVASASSNYLSLATPNVKFGDADFSITFAYRASALTNNQGGMGIWDGSSGYVFIGATFGTGFAAWGVRGTGATTNVFSDDQLDLGTTYRFYLWHDAANDIIGMRINDDDELEWTAAHSGGSGGGVAPFLVGRYQDAISTGNEWYDELRFYNRLLTSAEITHVDQTLSGG